MARVLVVGHVTLDRYGETSLAGGSAYYAGQAWRALGAAVRVATAFGEDFPPAALAGLECWNAGGGRTTRFENRHAADGTRAQRVDARAPPLEVSLAPARWRDCDVLHLAPVLGEVELEAWTGAVKARFVGIGAQGWVRDVAPDGAVVQPEWRPDPALLSRRVHAACVGEDDLRGQPQLLELLARSVPVVAFTRGEQGCDVISNGRTVRVGVYRTRAVDPVGAGDVFSAGFFHGLAAGATPVEAARLGAAAASIVVEARAGEALERVGAAYARSGAVPVHQQERPS